MDQDEKHLRLLWIWHYVVAAASAFAGCLLIPYVIADVDRMRSAPGTLERQVGANFLLLDGGLVLAGWVLAFLLLHGGRNIVRRTRLTFCTGVAAVSCLFVPLGTILGALTMLVLSRPSVQALFAGDPGLDVLRNAPPGPDDGTSGRVADDLFTDLVTGPNVRANDNLCQAIAVFLCAAVGIVLGAALMDQERRAGVVLGALGGSLFGLFAGGLALMIYRTARQYRSFTDWITGLDARVKDSLRQIIAAFVFAAVGAVIGAALLDKNRIGGAILGAVAGWLFGLSAGGLLRMVYRSVRPYRARCD